MTLFQRFLRWIDISRPPMDKPPQPAEETPSTQADAVSADLGNKTEVKIPGRGVVVGSTDLTQPTIKSDLGQDGPL